MDEVYGGLSLRLGFTKKAVIDKIEDQFESCKRKYEAALYEKRKKEEEIKKLRLLNIATNKKASAVFMAKSRERRRNERIQKKMEEKAKSKERTISRDSCLSG